MTFRCLLLPLLLVLAACQPQQSERVDPRDYDAFWLWAGVEPPPVLKQAKSIYILAGELRDRDRARFTSLRPGVPHLTKPQVWLVVRTDTLAWDERSYGAVLAELARWKAAGNNLQGLQVDFDARTRHLEEYAHFLTDLRHRLPRGYRLSVTGLLDWSAHGDPQALTQLRGTIDEVVIQTYQGRSTIPGYEAYFARLGKFDLPFRVGLVERGHWREPAGLKRNPHFRGYVVFLLPKSGRRR